MRILAVSDRVVDWIYSPRLRLLQSGTDLVVSCGDLPSYYLEYIVSTLDIPLLFVNGNHSLPPDYDGSKAAGVSGAIDLHRKIERYQGYSFAGVEGSLRYSGGDFQYSQFQMWLYVIAMVPNLLLQRLNYGHSIDIFVTHAPPWGIHDEGDLPHQGIKAFRWLLSTFQPAYHLHGHIHVYRPDTVIETKFGQTTVINAYGCHRLDFDS